MDLKDKLKALLGENPNFTDDMLYFQLDYARMMILNFCNLDEFPEALTETLLMVALKLLNRMGQEGSTSYSVGGESQSFDSILTRDIRATLYRYRKVAW